MTKASEADWSSASAARIYAAAELGRGGQKLWTDDLTSSQFLALLLAHRLHGDALRFLACGLQLRRAIWWGCLCVRHAAGQSLPPEQESTLKAAAAWCREPTEARRKAAEEGLGTNPLATAPGCLGWAVAVTGRRVPFPGMPPMAAQPELAPRAIAGALFHAAALVPENRAGPIQPEFVALGLHVLEGRHLWDSRRG